MNPANDIFKAIADPTRRAIITMIAEKPLNLNAIADNFDVTRQAVSLHIKILNECGLIMIKQQGRERVCEAKLDQLDEVADWISESKQLWLDKFKALENLLDELQKPTKKKLKPKKHAKRH